MITMATPTDTSHTVDFDAAVYMRLLSSYKQSSDAQPGQRWLLLEALHVLGQTRFYPHLETHVLMLGLGWRTRNWAEVRGQIVRLLLVPLGNALGRLPLGNSGRSNISAFQPMPVRQDIADAINRARGSGR